MFILNHFAATEDTVRFILYFTCIGQIISCLEIHHLILKNDFSDTGYYSWKILALDSPFSQKSILYLQNAFFNSKGLFTMLCIKIFCLSMLLFIDTKTIPFTLFLFIALLITLLLQIRIPYGGEGSDQMSLITLFSLLIGLNLFATAASEIYSIFFIAMQSILSYTSAGIAKFMSKKWRSGEAILDIFNTGSYGNKSVAAFLIKFPPTTFISICWGVIAFESLFAFTLLGNYYLTLFILSLGVIFHVLNAFIMGLNSFLFSFIATYPAILFLWHSIH